MAVQIRFYLPIRTLQGKKVELPVIGDLAAKQA